MRLPWLLAPMGAALLAGSASAQVAGDPAMLFDGYSYQLGEVGSLAIDASGVIFVADRQARAIVVLGSDGTEIGTIGRGGDGPAEFRSITSVAVAGDRVYALDDERRRVLVFSTSGDFVSGWSWPGELGVPFQLIPAGDTPYGIGHEIRPPVMIEPRVQRSPPPYQRYAEVSERGARPVFESRTDSVRGPRSFQCRGPRLLMGFPPILPVGPLETFTIDGELITSSIEEFSLRKIDPESGATAVLVESPQRGIPVSDDTWRAATSDVREAAAANDLGDCELDEMRPARMAAVRSVVADGEGGVWVETPVEGGSVIRGFDDVGNPTGSVTIPTRDSRVPLTVRGGKAFVVLVDELDVQSIAVFTIDARSP